MKKAKKLSDMYRKKGSPNGDDDRLKATYKGGTTSRELPKKPEMSKENQEALDKQRDELINKVKSRPVTKSKTNPYE
jgi:hypothetical protein